MARWARNPALLGVVLITLAGSALRAFMLDRWLEYDEAFTYLRFASHTLQHALTNYKFPNNHLFHSALVWWSTHRLGLSVWTLRLPAFVSGCALIPLTFLLARAYAGNAAGLIAAALVAGSSLLAQYSAMARGYSVQAALYVAALLAVARLVQRPGLLWALALAVLLALATFTVPTLIYGVASVFLWGALLVWRSDGERVRRLTWLIAAGVACTGATYLLYRPVLAFMRANKVTWGKPYALTGASIFHDVRDYLASFLPAGAGWLLFLLIAGGALCELRRRELPTALIWLGVPAAALLVHLRVASVLPFPRTFIFLMPLLCVLAGAGAQQLWSLLPSSAALARWPRAACAIAALALLLWTAVPGYAEHRALSVRAYPNTRYLYETLVLPMQPRDELAMHSLQMRPVLLYALIDRIPLGLLDVGFKLERVQRLGLDLKLQPTLALPGQRLALVARSPSDRNRIKLPRHLALALRFGALEWQATRRLPAPQGLKVVLWELRRAQPR